MEEPVGNQPRSNAEKESTMASLSGNSHKSRESASEKAVVEPREPVEKIVEGKVISRRPPWWKRFGQSMIADDASNVGEYILTDVVIPATKNLIVDMVSQSIERVLFGSVRGRIRRPSRGLGLRDQFDYRGVSEERPRRTMSRQARARHDFNEIVLEHRSEAHEVVEALIDRVDRYGAVTVADLYDYVGTTGSFADQRWGWTNLDDADVRQVPGGFLLDLPAPVPIR